MTNRSLPFTFANIEPLDRKQYDADVEAAHALYDSYCEETQTSARTETHAGTARTYSSTFSGMFKNRDDDTPSDT